MSEYVEFVVDDEVRFTMLSKVFEELKRDKDRDVFRDETEWLSFFDEETLSHFWWPTEAELATFMKLWDGTPWDKRHLDPRLQTPWTFGSLIEAFKDGEYNLTACRLVAPQRARLEFEALAWPYGGTEVMVALIEAFGFRVTGEDDGTGFYEYRDGVRIEIRYVQGDATSPWGIGLKIIVHVCNDVGGWGRGFVLALSRRWPETERAYRTWHHGQLDIPFALGEVLFVKVEEDTWVANLIGQHGIRAAGGKPPVRYEAIRQGLRRVANEAKVLDASVHMPRIGSGLAGGKWEKVAQIVEEELVSKQISVTVYDLPN